MKRSQVDPTVRIVGSAPVTIGDQVRIDAFTLLVASGPLTIKDHVHIGPHCSLHAGAGLTIHRGTAIAPNTHIFTLADDYNKLGLVGSTWGKDKKNGISAPVEIGEHVVIGAGTIILPGVKIPNLTAIAALSLVNKSLKEEGYLWGGIPVKKIRKRKP